MHLCLLYNILIVMCGSCAGSNVIPIQKSGSCLFRGYMVEVSNWHASPVCFLLIYCECIMKAALVFDYDSESIARQLFSGNYEINFWRNQSRRATPSRGGSKLWWHASRSSLGMCPRLSAIVYCVALVWR